MATRAEDYLESLLTDAFKGRGFQKINELLQEKEIEPLQKYSESLLNQLDKALRKELDKNEFHNISPLLKCIQLYLKSDLQEGESLFIEQGLVQKMSMIQYLRARASMILTDSDENRILMTILEDFLDCALVICRCSDEGKTELVNLFLPELGHFVTEANICCALRQEALRTLNSILDSVPREERKKFPLSEEMCLLTKDLAQTILDVGDYDLQVALSEALCRLMTKKWRDDLVHHWFEDNYLAEAFKEIKDREFETDCRKFLNQLNERLGDERRVYSFPCISAFADMNEVKKPSDEKLEEFWIDFNAGSHSVTFYVDSSEGALWDTVRLSKEEVSSYSLKVEEGEKTVKIYMKIPVTINKNEVTKIRICFSAKFEILEVLKKVLGDEKMMITVAEEEPVRAGEQTKQNEAVILESNNLQKKKNPSSSENTDSISDIPASQRSEQLRDTVTKTVTPVTMIAVSPQTDMEDTPPGPAEKPEKVRTPRMKAKSSEKPLEEEPIEMSTSKGDARKKRIRKASLVKEKKTEVRKDSYDFENSDSASHDKVDEAKEKILGQKLSSQKQSKVVPGLAVPVAVDIIKAKVVSENVTATREKNHFNTRVRKQKTRVKTRASSRDDGYRKHLFSESNSENASTDPSEKSWILDSQKRSLPRSLDYTRKRSRVRSKLKVLPVSSASSGSDYQAKKSEVPRPRAQEESLKKKDTSNDKGDDLPTAKAADETHSELEGNPVLNHASADDYSSVEEKPTQKFPDKSGKLSREEELFKRKDSADISSGTNDQKQIVKLGLENTKEKKPGVLSGTVLKRPKLSSGETSHLSSDIPYKPRRGFNSIEKEKETGTGQQMDEMDDTIFSEIMSEDISDSGVITAFESFTNQLKKLFWFRYKKMETCVQNALRNSEKNVLTLLNQIHECRLSKLETFERIVVEELTSLEKETQVLANMEKDAVDFWNAQALKLDSFCKQQKQRIQSVDSALGETAKSFVETIQNTTYELSEKKETNSSVFIISSD